MSSINLCVALMTSNCSTNNRHKGKTQMNKFQEMSSYVEHKRKRGQKEIFILWHWLLFLFFLRCVPILLPPIFSFRLVSKFILTLSKSDLHFRFECAHKMSTEKCVQNSYQYLTCFFSVQLTQIGRYCTSCTQSPIVIVEILLFRLFNNNSK